MGSDRDGSQGAGALEVDGKLVCEEACGAFRQKSGNDSMAFIPAKEGFKPLIFS